MATHLNRSRRLHKLIYQRIISNSVTLGLLETCIPPQDQALAKKLKILIEAILNEEHCIQTTIDENNVIRDLLGWANREDAPQRLKDAIALRNQAVASLRRNKRQFIKELGLDWTEKQREEYLEDIPVIIVDPLDEPYPPFGIRISETEAIYKQWANHIAFTPQPDTRKPRYPVRRLDSTRIVHDIGPAESAIFQERDGTIVGVVLRNFFPDQHMEVLAAVDEAAGEMVEVRKSTRVCSTSR